MSKIMDKDEQGSNGTARASFETADQGEPYMRLVIEVTSEGYVSVAHYYRQNGDAMRDPEVVFDPANWRAVEYTQDSLGIYQRIKPGYYSPGIETFAGIWARSIKAQGFCEVMPAVPAAS